MPSDVFYWILNMSIGASITGLLIVLVGKIRPLPRRFVCALWLIPFLRMWLPVGISSEYGLMALLSRYTTRTVTVSAGGVNCSMMNFTMGAASYFPITYRVNLLEDIFRIGGYVWLTGALLLLLGVAVLYIAGRAQVKDARHLYGRVYLSDRIESPAVYGIFRGRILLNVGYPGEDLAYILLHEQAHIRRRDNLKRLVAIVTACVHWFNPLSWLFLKCYLENLELACDETALKGCSSQQRKGYALALLRGVPSRRVAASPFAGAKVRLRIQRTLTYQKLSACAAVALAVLGLGIGYVLLTNAGS